MRSLRWALGLLISTTLACSSSSTTATHDDAAAPDAGSHAGPDTWNNFAKAFCATYCVECHNATTPDPSMDPDQDFNIYANVKSFTSKIRCGVAPAGQLQSGCPGDGAFPPPGQFPAGPPYPDDAERLRMIAWINAGALED